MDAKEASFYTGILIISIVIGIIVFIFIFSLVRQHRRSVRLYRRSIMAEITTLERERTRIASDLHDEMGPVLSAVKFRINSLELQDDESRQQLEKASRNLDDLIRRMREISFNLMPNSLTRKGLGPAVKEFIDYCSLKDSLGIDFYLEENLKIDPARAINLYRIIQEVIHNAIRHSGASQLKIEIRRRKEQLVMATRDNGKGFDYESLSREAAGRGLGNILSRTEIMGGKMYVESAKDKGTSYIFEIPLNYERTPD